MGMNVLIIEDERPAVDRLVYLLQQYNRNVTVSGVAESIEDAVHWLKTKPLPDVVFMDIHLADGHSFEIFNRVSMNRPVIFTTAYDSYAIDAFRYLSLDYILKPVTAEAIGRALNKLDAMAHSLAAYQQLGEKVSQPMDTQKYKDRFVAKIGQRIYLVATEDIAWFEADNKIVHLVDKEGTKYVAGFTMEKLEQLLHPDQFVRINRRHIINLSAVEHMKPYVGSRMQVCLAAGKKTDTVIVSRERVGLVKALAC
jgi:DNA-binding LytR/AlgR family response regulator